MRLSKISVPEIFSESIEVEIEPAVHLEFSRYVLAGQKGQVNAQHIERAVVIEVMQAPDNREIQRVALDQPVLRVAADDRRIAECHLAFDVEVSRRAVAGAKDDALLILF